MLPGGQYLLHPIPDRKQPGGIRQFRLQRQHVRQITGGRESLFARRPVAECLTLAVQQILGLAPREQSCAQKTAQKGMDVGSGEIWSVHDASLETVMPPVFPKRLRLMQCTLSAFKAGAKPPFTARTASAASKAMATGVLP